MDLEILKKKISSFRSDGGRVRNVSDDLLIEILSSWELWTGPAKGFYTALGVSQKGISSIIGKAKKLRRKGFPTGDFKEIMVEDNDTALRQQGSGGGIEITWENGKLIRFQQVEQLIDFLRKVA